MIATFLKIGNLELTLKRLRNPQTAIFLITLPQLT